LTAEQIGELHSLRCAALHFIGILAAQLSNGLTRARAILGSEEESGLSDKAVKDAIWDQWFDVDKAVRWLLGLSQTISFSLLLRNNMLTLQTRKIARLQPKIVKVRDCIHLPPLFWPGCFLCRLSSAPIGHTVEEASKGEEKVHVCLTFSPCDPIYVE
jgi:hypothetical protein